MTAVTVSPSQPPCIYIYTTLDVFCQISSLLDKMFLWLAGLLILRVWASNASGIAPRGTFRFANIINGSFKVERMIGSRFLEDCLHLCVEFEPHCQVAWFIEEYTRCNLGYITHNSITLRGNYWMRIN